MNPSDKENQLSPEAILRLDAERRREIDEIRERVEKCMQEDLKLEHKADLMLTEQRLLKERVEHGISKTVSSMNKSLQDFMIEWGRKKEQDELRDQRIANVESGLQWIFRIFVVSVAGGGFTAFIIWAFSRWGG